MMNDIMKRRFGFFQEYATEGKATAAGLKTIRSECDKRFGPDYTADDIRLVAGERYWNSSPGSGSEYQWNKIRNMTDKELE